MSVPEKKEAVPAKPAPVERGWTVSFSVLSAAEGSEPPARRRLTPLDAALLAAGLVLFLVEPFAISMLLSHYRGPRQAELCAPSTHVVVVEASPEGLPQAAESPEEKSDVITPLNVRDPSSLIMGPGVR